MRKRKIIQIVGFVLVAIGAATSIYNYTDENPYIVSAGYFLLAIGMVFIAINGMPKKHKQGNG